MPPTPSWTTTISLDLPSGSIAPRGRGGNIPATGDAILAAARLLRANGAPTDMAGALYAYNPSRRYVRAVSAYASQLRANQRAFIGYYHWQVFYGDTPLPEGYPARPPTPAPG